MTVQVKPFDWMVEYTGQQEWGVGRGLWLWLALVLGGLGSGLYLVALYYQHLFAMVVGWFIAVALKGICHMLYLGRPMRVWRAFTRPNTSWISRGLIFVAGFGFFAALQTAPLLSPGLPWSAQAPVLNILVLLFALLLMIYPGFALSYVRAIPLWNNALLPVIFLLYGFMGGIGLFLPLGISGGLNPAEVRFLEEGLRFFLLTSSGLLALYLMTVGYTNKAGTESLAALLKGDFSLLFHGGVIFLGIVVPFLASLASYVVGSISLTILYPAMICELTGSFLLRYCVLKAGIYMPLIVKKC